jgi:hypothetical protein
MITLAQAAMQTGMARSSILRAIKRGALSGTRNADGTWLVDPAELARVFTVNSHPALHGAHPDPVAAVKLEAAQQRIADLERALSDMRSERDDWKSRPNASLCQTRNRRARMISPTLSPHRPGAGRGAGCARRGEGEGRAADRGGFNDVSAGLPPQVHAERPSDGASNLRH